MEIRKSGIPVPQKKPDGVESSLIMRRIVVKEIRLTCS
jgi:hypothetical protein